MESYKDKLTREWNEMKPYEQWKLKIDFMRLLVMTAALFLSGIGWWMTK